MVNLELPVRFENPTYGLLGMVLAGIFVVLLYFSLRRLRIAEKRLEPVKWRTVRRVVKILNVGMKMVVIITLSGLLATPYLPTTIEVPLDEADEEQMANYPATFMVLMDVSNSMKSSDLKPTRLQVCKSMARLLVDKMGPKDLVGFTSFAGEIYNTVLPTANRTSVTSMIENQTCRPSTAIGTALQASIGVLETYEGGKAVVLFSDGKNNWGVDPMLAAEAASAMEIPIFTVFVGTYGIEEADPLSLRDISNKTGGKFYEVRSEDMESLAAEVSKISREVKMEALKTVYDKLTVEAKDYGTPTAFLSAFLIAALFLAWFTGV